MYIIELQETFQNIWFSECALAGMASLWSVQYFQEIGTSGRSNALRIWILITSIEPRYFLRQKILDFHWPVKKPSKLWRPFRQAIREKEAFHPTKILFPGRYEKKWPEVIIYCGQVNLKKVRKQLPEGDFFLSSRFEEDRFGVVFMRSLAHVVTICKLSIDRTWIYWWIGFLKSKLSPRSSSSFWNLWWNLRSIAEGSVERSMYQSSKKVESFI